MEWVSHRYITFLCDECLIVDLYLWRAVMYHELAKFHKRMRLHVSFYERLRTFFPWWSLKGSLAGLLLLALMGVEVIARAGMSTGVESIRTFDFNPSRGILNCAWMHLPEDVSGLSKVWYTDSKNVSSNPSSEQKLEVKKRREKVVLKFNGSTILDEAYRSNVLRVSTFEARFDSHDGDKVSFMLAIVQTEDEAVIYKILKGSSDGFYGSGVVSEVKRFSGSDRRVFASKFQLEKSGNMMVWGSKREFTWEPTIILVTQKWITLFTLEFESRTGRILFHQSNSGQARFTDRVAIEDVVINPVTIGPEMVGHVLTLLPSGTMVRLESDHGEPALF
ncbi:MAG: hypothetical protein C5B49_07665 [Bdellovibrio sp.]|nr:MAG: hypothetical protein C5B49_07665 [Bdellovibrio sp.]